MMRAHRRSRLPAGERRRPLEPAPKRGQALARIAHRTTRRTVRVLGHPWAGVGWLGRTLLA